MKFSTLLVAPLLAAAASAAFIHSARGESAPTTDIEPVDQINELDIELPSTDIHNTQRRESHRRRYTIEPADREVLMKRAKNPALVFDIKDILLNSPGLKDLPVEIVAFLKTVPEESYEKLLALSSEGFFKAMSELAEGRLPPSMAVATTSAAPAATSAAKP
ncbi:hypothetical protein DRE_01062 [Drechslerella stenobrocha 248]|uniref:Uncharacterized protein n=1 Tax=Drechslerella stenobrocha 248 TaxID=1043628 RepID=W7HJU3_9PEZI|nr:hypothetical protein DRE_01062 [Drechslerella stenobrocha 248]